MKLIFLTPSVALQHLLLSTQNLLLGAKAVSSFCLLEPVVVRGKCSQVALVQMGGPRYSGGR